MQTFDADLHLHGKYAGGVSKDMTIPNIASQAKLKGLDIVATADILHEKWHNHCKENVIETENGIFKSEDTFFIIQTEVQTDDRIHHILFFPDFESAWQLREKVKPYSTDIDLDGRPRLRLSSERMAELAEQVGAIIGPAHAFTPYFGLYGKYDSIKDCYGNMIDTIRFLELGLSADTFLANKIPELKDITFLSNSDSHCVHPDTKIFLCSGEVKKISELEPGLCTSINFNDMTQSAQQCIKVHKRPAPNELVKLYSPLGIIKSTKEHIFFVLDGEQVTEKQAVNLKKGDMIASLRQWNAESKEVRFNIREPTSYFVVSKAGLTELKNIRHRSGLLQKDVASELGVHVKHFSFLENAKHRLQKEYLKRMCDLYSINYDVFCENYVEDFGITLRVPESLTINLAQILGYLIGDGGLERGRKARGFSFTDKDATLIGFYRDVIAQEIGCLKQLKTCRNSYRVRYPSAILDILLQIDKDIFVYSKKRRVPKVIFNAPRDKIAAFLRGLFDAEGDVGHHSVNVTSASLNLIQEVQALLLRLGVRACLYDNLLEKTKQKYRHKLRIYGQRNLRQFADFIGFNSLPKKYKLASLLSDYKQKPKSTVGTHIPIRSIIRQLWAQSNLRQKDMSKSLYYHILSEKSLLSIDTAEEFYNIFSKVFEETEPMLIDLRRFISSGIVFEPINKIEIIEADCEYVYDLTIAETERYIANGFVVHNSPWPHRLGREFNRFKLATPSFQEVKKAIDGKEGRCIALNAGFDPREGKYHCSACPKCYQKYSWEQVLGFNWRCQKCGAKIKKGVKDRIGMLAGEINLTRPPYVHIVPLAEIIASSRGVTGLTTATVQKWWKEFVEKFGSEIDVLMDVPVEELAEVDRGIAESIRLFRDGKTIMLSGGGGGYGKLIIPKDEDEYEELAKKHDPEIKGYYLRKEKDLSEFF